MDTVLAIALVIFISIIPLLILGLWIFKGAGEKKPKIIIAIIELLFLIIAFPPLNLIELRLYIFGGPKAGILPVMIIILLTPFIYRIFVKKKIYK